MPSRTVRDWLDLLEEEVGDHLVSDTSGLGKRKENVIGEEA